MRLFVAILLDDKVKSLLRRLQDALAPMCPGVRWVREEQLHLTLKFLGEVPDGDVNDVAQALRRSTAGRTGLDFDIDGCGCFPPRGPVRIVWAGVREETGLLNQYVESLERELEQQGFARERRPFSAHITVGRVREDRSSGRLRSVVAAHRFDPVGQSVSSVALMSSVLSSTGPSYAVVGSARFDQVEHP